MEKKLNYLIIGYILGLQSPLSTQNISEYGVYGDLSFIYPKPDSIYLRRTIVIGAAIYPLPKLAEAQARKRACQHGFTNPFVSL